MNINVVQLSNYVAPKVTEERGKEWVKYGVDNDYFDYLLDRYRGSPTNHAIINGVSEMIAGDGIVPLSSRASNSYAKALSLFADEDVHRWAFDLKCLGYYIMLVTLKKGVEEVEYTPVQNWRSGLADEEGVVKEYFYSDDWGQSNLAKFKPKPFNTLQPDSKTGLFVYAVKPYRSGTFYYPNVDYMGCLQYAHLEEEVGNFHLNNIMNGLAPGMIINFNNGDPGEEIRDKIEQSIQNKWGGSSNAGRFIMAFNDNKEASASIETVAISDLDKQYQFISQEATSKIMVGHRVTSPLLFGVRDGGGLGSNTDEIKTANELFQNSVIRPYQNFMIKSFEYILSLDSLSMPMRIKPLSPINEVVDSSGDSTPQAVATDALTQKAASYNGAQIASSLEIMQAVKDGVLTTDQAITFLIQMLQFDPVVAKALFYGNASNEIAKLRKVVNEMDSFIELGEELGEEWLLIDERKVDYSVDESIYANLKAKVPSSNPNATAEEDNDIFKVRYTYAPKTVSYEKGHETREFCRKMVNANKVYRINDIKMASTRSVNPGWGPDGADNYDIFLYKGGGGCHHYWMRQVYLLKNNKKISVNDAKKIINGLPVEDRDAARLPINDPKVAQLPKDMPNHGFLKPRR